MKFTKVFKTLQLVLCASLLAFGCNTAKKYDARYPSQSSKASLNLQDIPASYNGYLAEARIWLGSEVWTSDAPPTADELFVGPPQKNNPISINSKVYCRYYPRISGGHNPKFRCYQTDAHNILLDKKGVAQGNASSVQRQPVNMTFKGNNVIVDEKEILRGKDGSDLGEPDEIKVKYTGKIGDRADVYTEVASTRLLWALGFPSDKMYPTQEVVCYDCPSSDPFKQDFGNGPAKAGAEITFPHGVVEKKFEAKTIEDFTRQKYHADRFKNKAMSWGYSGWDFGQIQKTLLPQIVKKYKILPSGGNELEVALEKGLNGKGDDDLSKTIARAVHFESLALAANLIWHMSNGEHQHRLVCTKSSITQDGKCMDPILVMQDVGSVFGGSGSFGSNSKGDLKKWMGNSIFKNAGSCELNLKLGNMGRASLSTEGVKFFSSLLESLSDEQVRSIFKAARFDIMNGGGSSEDWLKAFNAKKREVASVAKNGCPRSLKKEILGAVGR